MKFATKLALLFSALYLLSCSVITYLVYVSSTASLEREISESLEDQAFHTMDKIDQMLFEKYADLRLLASDPVLGDRNATPKQIRDRLVAFRDIYKTYSSLSLLDMRGNVISSTSDDAVVSQRISILNVEYYVDTNDYSMHISKSASGGRAAFNFSVNMKDENGVPVRILVADALLEEELYRVTSRAAGAEHHGDESLKVELADKYGVILYSSYRPSDVMEAVTPDLEFINKMLSGTHMRASGRHNHPGIGDEIHVFAREEGYLDYRGNEWTLLLHFPKRQAFAPAAHLRNRLIVLMLAIGLVTLLGLFLLARTVTKPLVALSDASRLVSGGDLNVTVEAASTDEVGQLTSSFNVMVSDLRRYRDSMEEHSRGLETRVNERTAQLVEANAQLSGEIEERRRAEDALRRHAQRLRILHRIDLDMMGARPVEEIAREAVVRIRQLVPYEQAGLALLNDETGEFELCVAVSQKGARLTEGSRLDPDLTGRITEAIRRGEVLVCNDLDAAGQKPVEVMALRANGVRSSVFAPLVTQGLAVGMLCLYAGAPNAFTLEDMEVTGEAAACLAVAIQNARLFRAVNEKSVQLSFLSGRLVEAEEAERRQLSRELHDVVGQNLSALNINLNIIELLLPAEATKARERLLSSQSLLETTIGSIRNIMSDLRPPVLDQLGLTASLSWYLTQFTERTSIPVALRLDEEIPHLHPDIEIALFRITQEALANVSRHSGASEVTVALESAGQGTGALLSISDNGVGFNPRAVSQLGGRRRLGLIGIRERAEAVGGHVRIESTPGLGTILTVGVPGSPGPGGSEI